MWNVKISCLCRWCLESTESLNRSFIALDRQNSFYRLHEYFLLRIYFENALIRTREVVFALGSPCELLINFRVKINTSCMSNFRRDSYHLRDNHEANFYIWLWRILSVVYHSQTFHETKKNKNTTKKREWGWRASCFKILGPLDRPLEGDQPNTSRRWNHKAKMEIDRARPS